jgi:uncharacterized membrane protein (DUF4010 family)
MEFEIPESALRLAVALAIGLLIGFERGWHGRALAEGSRIAGFRTFGLIGLLGGLTAALGKDLGHLIVAAGLLALAAAFGVAQWRDPRRDTDVSITTNIAALAAYGLGALAGTGEMKTAAAAGVVTALLLGIKPELHRLLERIERAELLATFRLLLISVVVLPVLPNAGYGPWSALNPYRIWWMVVLVAGISYAGYFAIKLIGPRRGVLVTGLLGGLVSSTATVLSLSRRAAQQPDAPQLWVSGMLAATATMFPRTLLIASVIAPQLSGVLALPLLAAALIAAAGSAVFARSAGRQDAPTAGAAPANPLDLKTAVQFALILAAVMVLVRALKDWSGDTGIYVMATASGLVDIDAITLSLGVMAAGSEVPTSLAAAAILLAAMVNTLVKPAIAFAVAGRAVGLRLLLPLLAAIGAIAAIAYVFADGR